MNIKEALIREIEQAPEPLIGEVLNYLFYLKAMHEEEQEDLEDAHAALEEASREGTTSLKELKKELGLS
jgi:hypothetical protein